MNPKPYTLTPKRNLHLLSRAPYKPQFQVLTLNDHPDGWPFAHGGGGGWSQGAGPKP